MNSSPLPSSSSPSTRRRHSAALKAQALAECQRPGPRWLPWHRRTVSIPACVHQWRRESQQALGFVPLSMPALAPPPLAASDKPSNIEVELSQGKTVLKVRWLASSASDCPA